MVQNQFIEVLLETGVVGLSIFIIFFLVIIFLSVKKKVFWITGIIVAFVCQSFFFSGYPNSLHVFIFLAFAYSYLKLLRTPSEQHRKDRLK